MQTDSVKQSNLRMFVRKKLFLCSHKHLHSDEFGIEFFTFQKKPGMGLYESTP